MSCGMRKLPRIKIEMVQGVQWCKSTTDEQKGITSNIREGFCAYGWDNGSCYKGEKKTKTSKGVGQRWRSRWMQWRKVVATKKISKLIHLEVIALTIDEWEKMCR